MQSDMEKNNKNSKQVQQVRENQKESKEDLLINIGKDIHSIKNMMVFFVVLTILGLLARVYWLFAIIPELF